MPIYSKFGFVLEYIIICNSLFLSTIYIKFINRCVCVLYNLKKSKQTFIKNDSKKPLTCAAFSSDGNLVVTGEVRHLRRHLRNARKISNINNFLFACLRSLVADVFVHTIASSTSQRTSFLISCEV